VAAVEVGAREAVSADMSMQSPSDPRTQVRQAHLMLTGKASSFGDQAIKLVEAACAQKSAEALLYHAALAARGHGRPQNLDDAFRYVAEAAALGDTRAKGQLMALGNTFDRGAWFGPVQMQQHHAAPRVFTMENFLPKPVCIWLIKQARKNLQRAPVQLAAQAGAFAVEDSRSNTVAGSPYLRSGLCLIVSDYANRPFIPPIRRAPRPTRGSSISLTAACSSAVRAVRSGSGLFEAACNSII